MKRVTLNKIIIQSVLLHFFKEQMFPNSVDDDDDDDGGYDVDDADDNDDCQCPVSEDPYSMLGCDCQKNIPGKTGVILGPLW